MTGLPRNATEGIKGNAKALSLGLSFGMGPGRTCKEMGIGFTRREWKGKEVLDPGPDGQRIFEEYHRQFPRLRSLLETMTATAKGRGYVRTLLGRRARFPGGYKTHAAGPYIFQGGAADLMKMKLVELDRACEQLGTTSMLSTVHDEASFSNPAGEGDAIRAYLKEVMETTGDLLCVPIRTEWEHGTNWAEASGL
jgi:DNA polymerase I-like protein with 3'-5' exonuclease and polymerase domains